MINMLGNTLRPVYADTLQEDEPIYFDVANSYWPKSLKADDPFDGNFKLTINAGSMSQNRDIVVVVLYKGIHYLLGTAANVPPNSVVTLTWAEGSIPTIKEFIESLGGSITETTTLSLTWETGYRITDTTFQKTDELPTSIYVEVPSTNWLMIAVAGGIIIGVGAIGYSVLKKPVAVRT